MNWTRHMVHFLEFGTLGRAILILHNLTISITANAGQPPIRLGMGSARSRDCESTR